MKYYYVTVTDKDGSVHNTVVQSNTADEAYKSAKYLYFNNYSSISTQLMSEEEVYEFMSSDGYLEEVDFV